MQARRRKRCWLNALVGARLVCACVVGAIGPQVLEASDLYFPATKAYHRRNYDPFDQTVHEQQAPAPVVQTSHVEASAPSDAPASPEAANPFASNAGASAVQPAAYAHVMPAKFLAAPEPSSGARELEPLPTPPTNIPTPPTASTQADGPDEPGAQWTPKPLCELTTNTILPGGVLPRDYWNERTPQSVAYFDPGGASRGWPVNSFNWVASCLAHNPLYFEEINLERYGYGCGAYGPCCTNGIQSLCSAAHFFGTVPALPYKMAVDCPRDCDYTLGYYRPGSCPPWQYNCCSRCSALGGLSAGGAAVGLIFLIP